MVCGFEPRFSGRLTAALAALWGLSCLAYWLHFHGRPDLALVFDSLPPWGVLKPALIGQIFLRLGHVALFWSAAWFVGKSLLQAAGFFGRDWLEDGLLACGLGSAAYALLPLMLHLFGTGFRPGVPADPSQRPSRRNSKNRASVRKPVSV